MHTRYARILKVGLLLLFFSAALPCTAQTKQEDGKDAGFSDAVAGSLMRQLRDGLIARDVESTVKTFDGNLMPDYATFREQLRSFLDRWDNIRIHYQIGQVDASCGSDCGTARVQFEIEADDVQSQLPAMRRSAQLQLTFARGSKGWKIVNLKPRELFR